MLNEVDEIMADEVALMEEAELEALASTYTKQATQSLQAGQQDLPPENEIDALLFSMDDQIPTSTPRAQTRPETPYGSDDDEYDHIFMDVIQEENRMASQPPHPSGGGDDMMDMDMDMSL
jgi:hypothetical protein